jgi:hypothetical protein
MAWGNFLLVGDMGQQLNLSEQAEELGRLRRSIARRQSKDLDQDARIAALAEENLNLKVGMAGLVHMLVARGVLGEGEIADLVHALDCADPGSDADCSGTGTEDGTPPVAGTGLMALVRREDGPEARPASFKSSRNNGRAGRPSVNSRQRCLLPTT